MKEITVVSNSLIVNELLKLIFAKRDESVSFQNENDIKTLQNSLVILDDSINDLEHTIEHLRLQNNQIILLGESQSNLEYQIKKPFLPQDIEKILDRIQEQKKSNIKTKILDPDEIAHIKALMALDDDEEEENQESPLSPLEKLEQKISFKIKGKEAKELLLALTELDPKNLKKMLKKSKVSLKISFKESRDA